MTSSPVAALGRKAATKPLRRFFRSTNSGDISRFIVPGGGGRTNDTSTACISLLGSIRPRRRPMKCKFSLFGPNMTAAGPVNCPTITRSRSNSSAGRLRFRQVLGHS
jgi:hypothetical protein